jgi:hypothetical protein
VVEQPTVGATQERFTVSRHKGLSADADGTPRRHVNGLRLIRFRTRCDPPALGWQELGRDATRPSWNECDGAGQRSPTLELWLSFEHRSKTSNAALNSCPT